MSEDAMYATNDSEFASRGWSSEIKVSKLSVRGQLVLNVLWFALNAQSAALLPLVIPAQIVLFISSSQIGSAPQVLFLSWLIMGAAIVSLFMPPIIGTLSDRTPGGFGRRRPYIVIGGLLLVLSTPLLVQADSMVPFLVGLSLLQVGKNILTPAYQGLMPDRVPKVQRGETAGYVGGMTILGNVVGLGLAAWLLGGINQHAFTASMIRSNAGIYYIVTAALMLVGVLVTVCGVREMPLLARKRTCASQREKHLSAFARRFLHEWVDPWRNFNFTMVFLTRALLMLGLVLFMTDIPRDAQRESVREPGHTAPRLDVHTILVHSIRCRYIHDGYFCTSDEKTEGIRK